MLKQKLYDGKGPTLSVRGIFTDCLTKTEKRYKISSTFFNKLIPTVLQCIQIKCLRHFTNNQEWIEYITVANLETKRTDKKLR